MMGFFTAHVNAQLAKLRADNARLHSTNCNLLANNDWLAKEARRLLSENQFLADENEALHGALAAAVENNRRIQKEILKFWGHPCVAAEQRRTIPLN